MEPGSYYVGDLCYVMHKDWEEAVKLMFPNNGGMIDGELQLKDGRKFAVLGTKHGDGSYVDQKYREYPVDSGSIGCIALNDIDPDETVGNLKLGHVIHFESVFGVYEEDGKIHIGDVVIDTDEKEQEEEYDDSEDVCYEDDYEDDDYYEDIE